jgi:hypothetical protein
MATEKNYDEHWIPINPDNIDEGWFAPANHLPHKINNWNHVSQESKNEVIAKYGSLRRADIAYAYRDLKRLQDFNADTWWCIGIIVTAKIEVSEDEKNWAHEEVNASLWGIESDATEEHKQTIIEDLKSDVTHDLKIWGFSTSDIATAMSLIKEE